MQNPKFQEPVTLDFLDAELENDIKVEVQYADTWKYPYHTLQYTSIHTHIQAKARVWIFGYKQKSSCQMSFFTKLLLSVLVCDLFTHSLV